MPIVVTLFSLPAIPPLRESSLYMFNFVNLRRDNYYQFVANYGFNPRKANRRGTTRPLNLRRTQNHESQQSQSQSRDLNQKPGETRSRFRHLRHLPGRLPRPL